MSTIILTPVNLIQIVFCTLFIFSIVILLPKKKNRRLIYQLTASSSLIDFNFLENMGLTYNLYLITPSYSLIFGPLFYFLVRQLTLSGMLSEAIRRVSNEESISAMFDS